MYCSTHRVPSATKRRSLLTSYRSYRYRHRYQYKSLPDYFFIGQRGVDGAAARAINMGRSRTRSRYIRRFLSKARGWLSVVHFCEQTFAPHSVVSAFLRRLVLFASHPPNPIKVTLLGYICVECMSSRVYFAHCMYCVVVVCMGGSAAVAQISERPRSIAYPVCSTFINSLSSRKAPIHNYPFTYTFIHFIRRQPDRYLQCT